MTNSQMDDLVETLLSYGGEEVSVPDQEPDLEEILERGYYRSGRGSKRVKRMPVRCHENAALFWRANQDIVAIVTGYALSADGLWRQHSWIKDTRNDKIIETTVKRVAYFGFDLTEAEAEAFFRTQIPMPWLE